VARCNRVAGRDRGGQARWTDGAHGSRMVRITSKSERRAFAGVTCMTGCLSFGLLRMLAATSLPVSRAFLKAAVTHVLVWNSSAS